MRLTQVLERGHLLGRQHHVVAIRREGLDRRARAVGGKRQTFGNLGQLRGPVRQALGQRTLGEPVALPDGKVRVLHRQRRQRIVAPRVERVIQRQQLAIEIALRPCIRHDVVDCPQQHVVGRPQPQ